MERARFALTTIGHVEHDKQTNTSKHKRAEHL
jgi:hypothetical protein